jgi:PKD repeat protein
VATTAVNAPVQFKVYQSGMASQSSFSISFGDGTANQTLNISGASFATCSHAFTTQGTYTVQLTLISGIPAIYTIANTMSVTVAAPFAYQGFMIYKIFFKNLFS